MWCRKLPRSFHVFLSSFIDQAGEQHNIFTTFVEKTATGCQTAQNFSNVNKQDCSQQHLKRKFAVTMVIRQ